MTPRRVAPNLAALSALMVLPACVAMSTGGAGTLRDGSPVVAQAEGRPIDGYTIVTISSPKGWICDGTYKHTEVGVGSTVTFPLNCNDGRNGRAIIAANQFQDQVNVVFSIGPGREGSVTLGRL